MDCFAPDPERPVHCVVIMALLLFFCRYIRDYNFIQSDVTSYTSKAIMVFLHLLLIGNLKQGQ